MQRLIRLKEVVHVTGLSRSRIYELEVLGSFPKRIALSPKTTVWVLDEIERWVSERIAARDQEAPARKKLAQELIEAREKKRHENELAAA